MRNHEIGQVHARMFILKSDIEIIVREMERLAVNPVVSQSVSVLERQIDEAMTNLRDELYGNCWYDGKKWIKN